MAVLDKEKFKELGNRLTITASGYEGLDYVVPVLTIDEYLEQYAPNQIHYCECVILPDGRIIPAQPSHAIVMDSLLNFLNGNKPFTLSMTWLVEERVYYTGAVMVWNDVQTSFSLPTSEQAKTILKLAEADQITSNVHSYDIGKQRYFTKSAEDIHQEAVEQYKQRERLARAYPNNDLFALD